MKTILLFIAGAALFLAGGWPMAAQEANSASRPNFDSFQVIDQNNIFNPYRRPAVRRNSGPPPPRIYYFTLAGAMSYENKGYAFFNGTGVSRGKVFSPSDTINGYRIAEISNNTVKLAAASNQFIILKVGMQMRREDNGPWKLLASAQPSANASSSDSAPSSDDGAGAGAGDDAATPTPPESTVPGADSDVIKRLMRRRAEENGDTNSSGANGDPNQ
jgi:hypothetical protein